MPANPADGRPRQARLLFGCRSAIRERHTEPLGFKLEEKFTGTIQGSEAKVQGGEELIQGRGIRNTPSRFVVADRRALHPRVARELRLGYIADCPEDPQFRAEVESQFHATPSMDRIVLGRL